MGLKVIYYQANLGGLWIPPLYDLLYKVRPIPLGLCLVYFYLPPAFERFCGHEDSDHTVANVMAVLPLFLSGFHGYSAVLYFYQLLR